MVKNPKKHIVGILCALILVMIPIGVYLFVTRVVVAQNEAAMREMVIESAEREMKMMVENVIASIESVRDETYADVDHKAEELGKFIRSSAIQSETTVSVSAYSDILSELVTLQVLVEDQSGASSAVLFDKDQVTELPVRDISLIQEIANCPIYRRVEKDGILYHIFARQADPQRDPSHHAWCRKICLDQ